MLFFSHSKLFCAAGVAGNEAETEEDTPAAGM